MVAVLALLAFAILAGQGTAAQQPQGDGIAALLDRLQAAATAGDRAAVLALGSPESNASDLDDLARALTAPPAGRIVINERDRNPLARGQRVLVEIFSERGIEGRLGTWRLDLLPGPTDGSWAIAEAAPVSLISGLYRLSLDTTREYDVHDLTLSAPDLSLHMSSGRAFVADTPEGPTAVVLLGSGQMRFAPPDPAERTQLRIFARTEVLTTGFDAAFIRIRGADFANRFDPASLKQRPALPADLRKATAVFDEYVGRTLQIDLSDLSRDRWSLSPPYGDIIAEIRTSKLGSLTYTRSWSDHEDISLYDRRRRKNISVYASTEKLAESDRFYSEDDEADYDVLSYDIDADITPERLAISGTARLKLRLRSGGLTSITLRLAETLAVRRVFSPQLGRLLALRVVGQNSLIVNLPDTTAAGSELSLEIEYAGHVAPQSFDREAIDIQAQRQEADQDVYIAVEPRYLYSNRSYWYPQASVTDYATARLRISVPPDFAVVGTGNPMGSAPAAGVVEQGQKPRRTFVFDASQPVRYLAVFISRLTTVTTSNVAMGMSADTTPVALTIAANPRQTGRAREKAARTANILQFYASLAGGAPYPSFTLAVTESDRPGGHSPAYFVVLNEVAPMSKIEWRADPVSFEDYPSFFLAHELAHQWWGQAVGWKNYHEQWISEGFAQYFAVLYAGHEAGSGVPPSVLRRMRSTAIAQSDQGPVYLGYRLGHLKGDDAVFRSIIYNKAAMVLHMLRRLLGDETFFAGLKDFYGEWKYKKAGTEDFRLTMQRRSGRDLSRFFDAWIYGSAIPQVAFSFTVSGSEVRIRFDQPGGPITDAPVTVTVVYTSGETMQVTVPISDRVTERTIPLSGPVRSVVANNDNAALVTISRTGTD